MIDMQIDMMKYFPDFVKSFLCGDPLKDQIYYQYTTAFPVATAMAQTWNLDLLEQMGQAVGEEVPEEIEDRFEVLRDAIDQAVLFLRTNLTKRKVMGFEDFKTASIKVGTPEDFLEDFINQY